MILEYYYEGETVLTPEQALQKNPKFANSFKDSGGLKLGYQCLSQQAFENAHAIFQVQLPLWNFYSDQVHFVKSPHHGLEECLRLCEEWNCDRHLAELALCVGSGSFRQFNFLMGMVENESDFAKNVWDYALQCLANRCSTFSKYCSPPHSWALVLSNNPEKQWQGMTAMRSDWKFLLALEMSNAPFASDLASDLRICFGAPERLLAQCYESVSWRALASPRGIELLVQLLGGFADSKLIEDIHQRLRNATGSKANDRLHGSALQTVVQHSGCLEAREIPHPCAISKDVFVSSWSDTKPDFRARRDFNAGAHRLPAEYSKILTPKTWPTISEQTLTQSSAGWMWLRHYLTSKLSDHGFRVQAKGLHDAKTVIVSIM